MAHPSWTIGDITITSIFETELTWPLEEFLQQPRTAIDPHRDWMSPYLTADDELRMPVQALLVEADGLRLVVDTCIGNGKQYGPRMAQFNDLDVAFLEQLAECGFTPESVDYVITTHLHIDHVGWNTRLVDGEHVPTFPRARYVMTAADVAHWRDRPGTANPFAVSVAPVIAAGLADLVASDHRISPSVSLAPTPGHTPGHVSVRLASRGEVAYVTGDMVHSPIQFAHPDWKSMADSDPDEAVRSRQWLIGEVGGTPQRVIGTHFATPTVGRIVAGPLGWEFRG